MKVCETDDGIVDCVKFNTGLPSPKFNWYVVLAVLLETLLILKTTVCGAQPLAFPLLPKFREGSCPQLFDLEKRQNSDITNLEESITEFKLGFSKNYQNASKKFHEAIDNIDKSIAQLQKTKDDLQKTLEKTQSEKEFLENNSNPIDSMNTEKLLRENAELHASNFKLQNELVHIIAP